MHAFFFLLRLSFRRSSGDSRRFRLYLLFASGCPLLLLSLVALVDADVIQLGTGEASALRPRVGEHSCFMTIKSASVFFYLPIFLMLCFNMVMFFTTIHTLRKSKAFSRQAGIHNARISKNYRAVSGCRRETFLLLRADNSRREHAR